MSEEGIISLGTVLTQSPLNNVDTVIDIGSYTECPICINEYPSSEFLSVCDQKHRFCKSCMKQYLLKQISEFQYFAIKCPQDLCPHFLKNLLIKQALSETEYQRYQVLLTKKKDLNKLFCPNPSCSKDYVPQKSSKYFQCECGTKICNKCGKIKHRGQSCAGVIQSELKDYYAQNLVKYCPKCKVLIFRESGCDRVYCSVCKYQWCWRCQKRMTNNHELFCIFEKPRPMRIKSISDLFRYIKSFFSCTCFGRLLLSLFLALVIISPIAAIITVILTSVID